MISEILRTSRMEAEKTPGKGILTPSTSFNIQKNIPNIKQKCEEIKKNYKLQENNEKKQCDWIFIKNTTSSSSSHISATKTPSIFSSVELLAQSSKKHPFHLFKPHPSPNSDSKMNDSYSISNFKNNSFSTPPSQKKFIAPYSNIQSSIFPKALGNSNFSSPRNMSSSLKRSADSPVIDDVMNWKPLLQSTPAIERFHTPKRRRYDEPCLDLKIKKSCCERQNLSVMGFSHENNNSIRSIENNYLKIKSENPYSVADKNPWDLSSTNRMDTSFMSKSSQLKDSFNIFETPLLHIKKEQQSKFPSHYDTGYSSSFFPTPVVRASSFAPTNPVSPLRPHTNDTSSYFYNSFNLDSILRTPVIFDPSTTIEFVNGGKGIKNPMLNEEMLRRCVEESQSKAENSGDSFKCPMCPKLFFLQRQLTRHLKVHFSFKRFLCVTCLKGFNDTFDLKRHYRIHSKIKPYKCDYCEKDFTQLCSLESHSAKIHGVSYQYGPKERREKKYVCEDCGHTSKQAEDHYNHLKTAHPSNQNNYLPPINNIHPFVHYLLTIYSSKNVQ